MSVGLDTSVVVRLLVGEPPEQAAAAWRLVDEHAPTGEPVRIADLVVAETFFVLQHHYRVPLAEAIGALLELVSDPRIAADEASTRVLKTVRLVDSKPGFIDRLIHGGYHDDGVAMATFDKAAARLPNSRLLRA